MMTIIGHSEARSMDDMTKHGSTAYDHISYPGHPFGETHPDHMGTLGALFGMTPAPLSCCRVLELGCGRWGRRRR